jgi:hypothetical protein
MAMVKCKECKGDVSSKAKKCPHCGIDNPAVTKGQMLGGVLFLGIMCVALVTCMSGNESGSSSTPKKSPEEIAAEEAKCRQDLQCWGSKHSISAAVYCDDQIEKLAKYSHEWTDGMLEPKISHFRWLDKEAGRVTFIGDKIKFQNGFGAWTNMVYECDFDPKTNTVFEVRAEAGRL